MAILNQNQITEDMVKKQRQGSNIQPDESLRKREEKPDQNNQKEEYKFTGMEGSRGSYSNGYTSAQQSENSTLGGGKISAVQGNIAGRADAKVDISTLDAKGYYHGHRKINTDPMGQQVKQTVENQYEETQAKQGYNHVDKAMTLMGTGVSSSKIAASELQHQMSMHDNKDVRVVLGRAGYKTVGGNGSNAVNDYYNNVRVVEDTLLHKYGINGKNLNLFEIKRALARGKVGGLSHLGESITLNKDSTSLLKELQFYRQNKLTAEKATNLKGEKKGRNDALMEATGLNNADAVQGYKLSKRALSAAGAVGAGTKFGAKSLVKGAAGLPDAAKNASLTAQKLSNKLQYSAAKRGGQSAKELDELRKKGVEISNKKTELHIKASDRNANIDKAFSPIDNAKKNAKAKIGERISKITPNWVKQARKKIADSKILAVFRKPFSILNTIKAFVKKAILIIAAVFGIIVLIWMIFMAVALGLGSGTTGYEEAKGETVGDSTAQKLINYLYSWQEAYTENTFECEIDSEQGRIWAEKRLPDTWFTQIEEGDPTLMNSNNVVSVFYRAPGESTETIAGFNFNKYWGQRAWADDPLSGCDVHGERPVYETSITDTFPIQVAEANEYGEVETVTEYIEHTVHIKFYGNAGLYGDIGEYDLPKSIQEYWEEGIDEIELDINGNSENSGYSDAYAIWEDPDYWNPDVECTFKYLGSCFTYYVSPAQYTKYYNASGELTEYGTDEFYKALLIMSMGLTNNDNGDADFATLYAYELFDKVMHDARVVLWYEYVKTDDGDEPMKAHIRPKGDTNYTIKYMDDYYECHAHVVIYLERTGIIDLMYIDATMDIEEIDGSSWVHYGEVGNEWAHSSHTFYDIENRTLSKVWGVKSQYVYPVQNRADDAYRAWYTDHAPEISGTHTPLYWGMNEYENSDRSLLVMRDYGSPGIYMRKYPEVMDNCIGYYSLSNEDISVIFGEVQFPSGWLAEFSQGQIHNIVIERAKNMQELGFSEDEIKKYSEQMQFVLSTVGRFGYVYGMHCTGPWKEYNGRGFDCSGYVSYLLMGLDKFAAGKYCSAGTFAAGGSGYSTSAYGGDVGSLKLFDLIVKNHTYGDENHSENHVVMYVGELKLPGDDVAKPYIVECTKSGRGTRIAPADRVSGYEVVVHTGG
ncbi:MAG: hypothetical protein K6G10_06775 [Butyrivibrio sp.]|nr:hypothetical protein [Butyrivibrio sp.]